MSRPVCRRVRAPNCLAKGSEVIQRDALRRVVIRSGCWRDGVHLVWLDRGSGEPRSISGLRGGGRSRW